jgi:hypothetical protein
MRSPDLTRSAASLPPVYQEHLESFGQVDAYLGLADELARVQVEALDDLGALLGPDASLRWPGQLPATAGPAALAAALTERYDSVARWVAFEFPGAWATDLRGLTTRRTFLAKATRLWRRRGTPRGFIDWCCLYFGLHDQDREERPVLVEHYKIAGPGFTPEPFTATLFVPLSPAVATNAQRVAVAEFVRWYSPAHLAIRVCFVPADVFDTFRVFADPAMLAGDSPAAVATYEADLRAQATLLRELMCTTVSAVSHADGIHLYGCPPDRPPVTERDIDHLGIGALPTDE